jgi:hypothetical protein
MRIIDLTSSGLDVESWSYISPNLILDNDKGLLWDVTVNLESITMSCTDKKKIVQFLMRRTLP